MSRANGQPVAIIMAKFPEPGLVKSRLCLTGRVRPKQAAELARLMLRCVVYRVANRWSTIIATSPNEQVLAMEELLGDLTTTCQKVVVAQGDGSLGQRMDYIWKTYASGGPVAFFGADTPDLPESYLQMVDAFFCNSKERLAAVGESPDGGYWTLAAQSHAPQLLERIEWSTNSVFATTCQRIRELDDQPVVLPIWPDVDTYEDLQELFNRLSVDSEGNAQWPQDPERQRQRCGGSHVGSARVMDELRSNIARLLSAERLANDKMRTDGS